MNSIQTSPLRVGSFTSSEIVALTTNGKEKNSFGKPFYTYIDECNEERRIRRPLEAETNAKALSWGKLVEKKAFELLGLEYQLASDQTIVHPEIDCWAGSPDAFKFDEGKTVVDLKCPQTLKSFTTLVKPLYNNLTGLMAMEWIRNNHKDGDKFYFQLISNAILSDSAYAELIVYCPFRSELDSIRELASNIDDPFEQKNYYWIAQATDDELPWIWDDGHYKNINIIRFRVPESDKKFLIERVKLAEKLLIPR